MLELIGYGARIKLGHPVQLGRVPAAHAPAPDTLILAAATGEGQKVLIAPGEASESGAFELTQLEEAGLQGWVMQQSDEGTRVVLGESKSLGELAEVSAGPAQRKWELKSSKGYSGSWPEGYNVLTTDESTTWPFELIGPDASLLYVRGPMPPERVPAASDLAVGDQKLVGDHSAKDKPWVELSYQDGDQEWRISYHFVNFEDRAVLAVCAQSPAEHAEKVRERAWDLADSLDLEQ